MRSTFEQSQLRSAAAKMMVVLGLIGLAQLFIAVPMAEAKPIKNKIAVFAALNKITARISHLEIPLNSEVEFGALTIIPRACNTRPPTEPPSTTSFIEVQETKLDGSKRRLFTGWVFAENPGVHAVEHPVFDVWLTSCKTPEAEVVSARPKKLQRRRTRVRSRSR